MAKAAIHKNSFLQDKQTLRGASFVLWKETSKHTAVRAGRILHTHSVLDRTGLRRFWTGLKLLGPKRLWDQASSIRRKWNKRFHCDHLSTGPLAKWNGYQKNFFDENLLNCSRQKNFNAQNCAQITAVIGSWLSYGSLRFWAARLHLSNLLVLASGLQCHTEILKYFRTWNKIA